MRKEKKNVFKKEDDFQQRMVDIARVTRVMAGGKRLRFRVTMVVGDKKNRVGIGVGKGIDVATAINKAVNVAKKNMISTPLVEGTLPCQINKKFGAAKVFLKPAKPGIGIIAGGAVRIVLELSGLQDVVAKIYGSKNKINNVKATIMALQELQSMVEKKKKRLKNITDNKKQKKGLTEKKIKKDDIEKNKNKNDNKKVSSKKQ